VPGTPLVSHFTYTGGNIFPPAPNFTGRNYIQFLSVDMPSLNISPANSNTIYNNPSIFNVTAGEVSKLDQGIDGLNYFRGIIEYAPTVLDIEWSQLGFTDYQKLSVIQPYYLTFVDYRSNGYYGRLILGGPQGGVSKVADLVALKAAFIVLSPSDANGTTGINAVSRMTDPTVSNSSFAHAIGSNGTGSIPSGQTNYYWFTFRTIYGETNPLSVGAITPSHANASIQFTWNWPTYTAYCTGASIYVSASNTASSAMKLYDVPVQFASGTPLAGTAVDYVGAPGAVVNLQPPAVSTAYRGWWAGGLWINEA
jgi:hypothetical protein